MVPEPDHQRRGSDPAVEAALDLEEILQHPRGSCVAITRILLEQPPDDVVERARRVTPAARMLDEAPTTCARKSSPVSRSSMQRPLGQALEQEDADRVQVGASVDRPFQDAGLFGGGTERRPSRRSTSCPTRLGPAHRPPDRWARDRRAIPDRRDRR